MNRENQVNQDTPRYEYRVFCTSLGHSADLRTAFNTLRKDGEMTEEAVTTDLCLLSAEAEIDNVKLRDGQLEIKHLHARDNGLEQWSPDIFVPLPLSADTVREHIFPALKLPKPAMVLGVPAIRDGDFTAQQLLDELVWPLPMLFAARIEKRRRHYNFADVMAQMDEVVINGATLLSLAIESTNAKTLHRARTQLGLNNRPNTNYVQALQYVLGLRQPPANENQIGVYM